jgi:atypical dual specificity phosphatase
MYDLQAVNVFSTLTTGILPARSTNHITNTETCDYHTMEFDCIDSGLPLCPVMVHRPVSTTVSIDAVVITEADLEGYDTYVDAMKGEMLLQAVTRKPLMKKLSCLFGSLKLNSICEPTPSQFTEVRAY